MRSQVPMETAADAPAAASPNSAVAGQERLTNLQAITLLYEVSSECGRGSTDLKSCLERVLDAAITVTGASKGNVQVLDAASDKLVIIAQRGFDAPFLESFAGVDSEQAAVCAVSKRSGARILVEDVTRSPIFVGQRTLDVVLEAGVRAVQSTPLMSGAGVLLGMISTHYSAAHAFSEAELHLLDLLARQASDFLERKRSDQGLALLASIVENSDDVIVTKNLDGYITSWNRAAERIFGYKAEEVIGKHISIIIPEDRLDEEPGILARLRRGERIDHFETVRRRKDGTFLDISLTISPVRDPSGQIIGASKIARDITELKRARAALKRSNEELEHRVKERTSSLEQAIVQMEDFTYSVSHDLRAPARVIHGLAQAALEDHGASMKADLRGLLERISGSALRMEHLTRDLLDYSRVARAEVKLAPVDLDHLVSEITDEQADLQPHRAEITVRSELGRVLGHEASLSQAVSNLLTNAVKFVAPGVTPKVELWTERRDGVVRLWVKDNGIGIEPRYHDRLFQLFERAHVSSLYEGTGMGLAIVRKAAEKMGGKVGVVSSGSGGSSFWIELAPAPPLTEHVPASG